MALLPRLKARLGSLFASAEDPRANSASVYQRHIELLARLEAALAEVAVSKRKLGAQTERMKSYLPQLQDQAKDALAVGREDVARLILRRRREAGAELRRIETQVMEVAREEQRLALARQRLGAQVEAFRSRQEVASARFTAAEAQVRINEALAGLSTDMADLGSALQQAESRTEHMQARATAIDDLLQAGSLAPGIATAESDEDMMLDPDEAVAVEGEIRALKRELRHSTVGEDRSAHREIRP